MFTEHGTNDFAEEPRPSQDSTGSVERARTHSGRERVNPAVERGNSPTCHTNSSAERETVLAGFKALQGAPCAVADDGSLEARLHHEPGLADALLGRDLLDPYATPSDRMYSGEARRLSAAIDHAISVSQEPIRLDLLLGIDPRSSTDFAPKIAGNPAEETPGGSTKSQQASNLHKDQASNLGRGQTSNLNRDQASADGISRSSLGLDLSQTIEMLCAVRRRRNALEAAEAFLLEQARREGLRDECSFIENGRLAQACYRDQRAELVQRAVIADIAMALRDGHDAIGQRMAQAQSLVSRGPRTFENATAGKVNWRNVAFLADQIAELAPAVAAKLDSAAADSATTASPAVFRRRVRKLLEEIHPTPIEVRHSEAACKRHVRTDVAADGMGYLTLFAPITAVNAIWDRLSQTAKRVRYGAGSPAGSAVGGSSGAGSSGRQSGPNDTRTLEQLRADTAIALLLDDGTLDLAFATQPAFATPAALARDASSYIAADNIPVGAEPVGNLSADLDPTDVIPGDVRPDEESDSPVCGRPLESSPFSLARIARSIRPRVFVTVPVLTLTDTVRAPALLDGTIPIDAETALELVGLATSFTRVLTDPYSGAVLGVDAKTYRPSASLRQWVQLRDATCRFPGCTRRAVEADVDHNTEWSKGGSTSSANLGALCRRHHTLKTIGAFTTLSRLPSEARSLASEAPITWRSPTGRRATTTAEPVPTTLHPPGFPLPRGPMPDAGADTWDDFGEPPF